MEVTGKTPRQDVIKDTETNQTNNFINCDPCQNEGEEQPAEGFCENCQEYLCSSCFKIHRRPAVWRHHVLLDKQLMPTSKTTKQRMIYDCTEPCSIHPTKILEYFCQTHAQLGCPLCVTKNHRMCNDVDYIPDIAEPFCESTEVKEICDTLQSLKEEIDKYSSTIKKEKVKVEIDEKNAKEQILQIRDELNSICDRLVENVERESECDSSNIKLSLKTCDEIKNKITKLESVIEKKKAELKVSQLFTEAKLSKIYLKECKEELESVKKRTKTRHFKINFDVEALRQNMQLTYHEQPHESYSPRGNMEQRLCDGTDDETRITKNRLSNLKSNENQSEEELMSKQVKCFTNNSLDETDDVTSIAIENQSSEELMSEHLTCFTNRSLEETDDVTSIAIENQSSELMSKHLTLIPKIFLEKRRVKSLARLDEDALVLEKKEEEEMNYLEECYIPEVIYVNRKSKGRPGNARLKFRAISTEIKKAKPKLREEKVEDKDKKRSLRLRPIDKDEDELFCI